MPGQIRPAKEITAKSVDWIWREHIPIGMLSCIAGRHKKGKSLLGLHIAADVSQNHNVLISAREDALPQVARPRIEVAGGNLERVHFQTHPHIQLPADLTYLADMIRENEYKLVILDPAIKHGINIYNLKAIQDTLEPLEAVAQETDSAILMITHTLKYPRKDAEPIDSIGGANGGLVGTCRAIYLFGVGDDPDERIMADAGSNISSKRPSLLFEIDTKTFGDDKLEIETGILHCLGSTEKTAKQLKLAGEGNSVNPVKEEAAAEWLTKYLVTAGANCKDKGRLKREIMEDALQYGFTESKIGRAKYAIGVNCPPAGPNARWWLPKEHPAWNQTNGE